uniref:Protein ZIP4 homolog n=1 Tax=Ciona savignyi TaxID=51511 RepID=H2ZE26_CIOSA
MALQAKENPHRMKKLYLLCKNLLCLLEPDECALLRQKTCLLMCAACGLTLARVADSLQSMIPELEEVLSTVADCRTVCEHLAAFSGSDFPQSNDKSAVLLLLYHFEALAKLVSAKRGDNRADDLDALFDELHSLPLADAKTFETIAGLAVEYPAYHAEICTRGLKVAIGKIEQSLSTMENKESKNEALKRLSGLYRMLIDTCLKQGSDSDPVNKEESWKHCNEAFLLLSKPDQSFPETELAWLTTRAWNVGVKLFVSDHVVEAEHWCAFALRLLAKLDLYKESYEKRMNNVYQEILEKKDLMTRKLHKTAV